MSSRVLIALMMILVSCHSADLRHENQQCSPVFVYSDASNQFIDVAKSYCNVRDYQLNINYVGPVAGTEAKMPLPYCDRCVGFKDYAGFASFSEIVRREINGEGFTEEESVAERINGAANK
jgi:hypothetical protein